MEQHIREMLRSGTWSTGAGEELQIGRHTVRLKRSLAEGGFAFIHLVEDAQTGRVLVLKRSSLQSHEGRMVYEKEASIMRSLAHPNIVQIVTAVELPSSRAGAILMEYCPKGHLLDALNSRSGRRMGEEAVLSIMGDVVSAVKYLHDKGITHRDIKLENILRSASGPHKLCDFGSCVQGRVPLETAEQRANEEEVVEKTTTQMYRAPEMVDLYMDRELTEKVDVWALGCVLYAVCYLKNPFQDAGNLGILNARIRIPEDSEFSAGLVDLAQRLLTASSAHRPTAAEVEECTHALSKGQPLPPPRNPVAAEPERAHGSKTAASSLATSASAGSNTASTGVSSRDGGRGGGGGRASDGSGRSGSTGGGKGTPPPKTAGGAPKPKEPQLNPNSVAARRLASRKSLSFSQGATEGNGAASERQATAAPENEHAALVSENHSVELSRQGSGPIAHGGTGGPTWNAIAVPAAAGGGGAHPPPEGWSTFAAFDEFQTSQPAPGRRSEDNFDASFDASAAAKAFGTPPPGHAGGAVSANDASTVRESRGSGDSSTGLCPLLDLGPRRGEAVSREQNGSGGGVAALGQQLAGAFPSPSPAERQAFAPSGTLAPTGWGDGCSPQKQQQQQQQQQAVLPNDLYGRMGQGSGTIATNPAFSHTSGQQQGAASAAAVPATGGHMLRSGYGLASAAAPPRPGGALAGVADLRRSASQPAVDGPNAAEVSGCDSHPWMVPSSGGVGLSSSVSAGGALLDRRPAGAPGVNKFGATFPAPTVGGGAGWPQAVAVAGNGDPHGRPAGGNVALGTTRQQQHVAGQPPSSSSPSRRAHHMTPGTGTQPLGLFPSGSRTLSPQQVMSSSVSSSPPQRQQQHWPAQQGSSPSWAGGGTGGGDGGAAKAGMAWAPGAMGDQGRFLGGAGGGSPPVAPSPPLPAHSQSNVGVGSGGGVSGLWANRDGSVPNGTGSVNTALDPVGWGQQQQQQQRRSPQQNTQDPLQPLGGGGSLPPPQHPGAGRW